MADNLKQKVVKGAVWTLLEKLSVQVVGFVVGMILARLLSPTDYGTVVFTSVVFAEVVMFVDIGYGKVCERRTLRSPVVCKERFEVRADANVISPCRADAFEFEARFSRGPIWP